MKALINNKHIIVELNEGSFLVDIGTSSSMAINKGFVTIEGKRYGVYNVVPLEEHPLYIDGPEEPYYLDHVIKTVKENTGRDIVGIIGNDILSQTGATIDFNKGTLEFVSMPLEKSIAVKKHYTDYLRYVLFSGDISFDGKRIENVLIDTGSQLNYVPMKYVQDLKKEGEAVDKSFRKEKYMGLKSPVYSMDILVADEKINAKVCGITENELRSKTRVYGYLNQDEHNAIISIADLFNNKKISIDYSNDRLYFE